MATAVTASLDWLVPNHRLGPYIGGRQVAIDPAAEFCLIRNPADGTGIAEVARSDAEVVDQAVMSAARTFESSAWRSVSPSERGRLLSSIAAAMTEHSEELAVLETLDTGKPLSQSRSDVAISVRYFHFYAGLADKVHGEVLPSDDGSISFTVRQPYGVVLHIIPWNSPLSQLSRGVAPSLAVGNTVVIKPSELAPLSSLYAAELFSAAGLPAGVCNVAPGPGPTVGRSLASHPAVRLITFTGSAEAGRQVLRDAAANIVPCNLELGGKSPTIIFADCNLDQAVRAGIGALTRNSGQSCSATTRLLVETAIHDEYVHRLAKAVVGLTVRPGIEDPDLGPLISEDQLARAIQYADGARLEGATVITGGSRVVTGGLEAGYFMQPTVLTNVLNSMTIARDEVFGPVQSVLEFVEEDEAIDIANDTDYGLAAGVFTQHFSRAHRVAARLDAGQVHINRYPAGGVETPFGGFKQSGIGREKGVDAIRNYTQVKTTIGFIDPSPASGRL